MINLTHLTFTDLAGAALFLLGCIVCVSAAMRVIVDLIFPLPRSASSKGDEIIRNG